MMNNTNGIELNSSDLNMTDIDNSSQVLQDIVPKNTDSVTTGPTKKGRKKNKSEVDPQEIFEKRLRVQTEKDRTLERLLRLVC